MNQAIETLTKANNAHFHALNALEAAQAERAALIQQVATEGGDATDKRLSKADATLSSLSTSIELADASRVAAQREYYIAQIADLGHQRDVLIARHQAANDAVAAALQHVHALVAQAKEAITALHEVEGTRNGLVTEGEQFDASIERIAAENPVLAAMHRSEQPRAKLGMVRGYSQITVGLETGQRGLFGTRK